MSKTIKLTQGKEAIVDDEDFEYLSQFKWYYTKGYAGCDKYLNNKRYYLKMHRIIMDPPDDMVVDHINHDTLDNRKQNLRVCTKQQNEMNQKPRSNANKISKYKGVSLKKDNNRIKRWSSYIQLSNIKYSLGHYYTEEGAARAYDKAAKEKFGEFAYLNFPNEVNDEIVESNKIVFNTEEEADSFIQGIEFVTKRNDHLIEKSLIDNKWQILYTWKDE